MSNKQEIEKSEEKTKIGVSDTELIDRIRAKLGGKELPTKLVKQILDTSNLFLGVKERTALTYKTALDEGFSKEEAKTIVAEIWDVSIRTVERYIPPELIDKKYISDKAIEDRNRKLKDHEAESTPGIVNEAGEYGYATGETETIEQTPEQQIKDLKGVIKTLQKGWDSQHEITVQGRTFNVKTHSDPIKKLTELTYREMEIVRALKSK